MSTLPQLRLITLDDAESALDLYAPYVRNTSITFECEVPSIEHFREKIETITKVYPWIVCEVNNQIVGYAYASRHRPKEAYDWSPESTIYIREGFHRNGLGRLLYKTLFEILTLQGFINVFAGVTQPNEKSDRFHQSMGFTEIGIFKQIGYKLGKWHDTQWYQLSLGEHRIDPPTPVSFFDASVLAEFQMIIEKANEQLKAHE